MKKRCVAMLLCLCMVLALLPTAVFAAEEYKITLADQRSVPGLANTSVRINSDYTWQGESTTAAPGTRVLLNCTVEDGYLFKGWTVDPAGVLSMKDLCDTYFDMPASDLTFSANVEKLTPDFQLQDGVATWNAVEGYQSKLIVDGIGIQPAYVKGENGKYTFDLEQSFKMAEYLWTELTGEVPTGSGPYSLSLSYKKDDGTEYSPAQGEVSHVGTFDYTFGNLTTLETPSNLSWDGFTAQWDAVENAGRYRVTFTETLNGASKEYGRAFVTGASCDLAAVDGSTPADGAVYTFTVQAMGAEGVYDYLPSQSSQPSQASEPYKAPSAQEPAITRQPQDADYTVGDLAAPLTVTANVSDGGTLSYQWYSNTTDSSSGGTKLDGETGAAYTPPTHTAGTAYYYCVVTNTLNGRTASTATAAAKVEVAPGVEAYDLTIRTSTGLTEVTSENAADVLKDGTVSYDPDTKTLTLDNADLWGIWRMTAVGDDLTVEVKGENTITIDDNDGISLGARLYLKGSGTLEIVDKGLSGAINSGLRAKKVTVDGITLRIVDTTGISIYTEAYYTDTPKEDDESINIINGADVTVTSKNKGALLAIRDIHITDSKVTATANGDESNAVYTAEGSIEIVKSTVVATATSAKGYSAIHSSEDLVIRDCDKVEAKSSGRRGIYAVGDITVSGSTVTASGTVYEGMVAKGTLRVENASLTASTPSSYYALVAKRLEVTASEVTAAGGLGLYDYNTGAAEGISFSLTPASGKLLELKVGSDKSGSGARHFDLGAGSPYDTAVNFQQNEMEQFQRYTYVHIGEHVHTGGTATCQDKAVCDDCGRGYGEVDPDSHSFTNYVYNNDATCTEDGTETAKCDRCGAIDTRKKAGTAGHRAVKTEAEAATCTEDGNIEYWTCEICGKYFDDEALTQEIEREGTVVKAKGHGETELKNQREATCTARGYTGDKVCKDCGAVVEKGRIIPMLAHRYKDGRCTACGAADPDDRPAGSTEPGDTSKPGDPAESNSPAGQDGSSDKLGDNPQMGDSGGLTRWAALAVLSASAAAAAYLLGSKRRKER